MGAIITVGLCSPMSIWRRGSCPLHPVRTIRRLVDDALATDTTAEVVTDDLNGEFVERAAELGHAVAALSLLAVDTEDGVLVGIERHRLAIALQIGSRGPEVVEGRLCRHEARMHDPACGVIHEGEEGALRSPVLEPPVLGAINLDQLAHARAGLVLPTLPGNARLAWLRRIHRASALQAFPFVW